MINPQPAVRVDAREAERLARIAAMRKRDHVRLTPYEIQSGLDRVRLAELLIQQLPADHDGRNTWLHNYAGKKHEDDRVALTPAPTEAGGVREPTKAVIAALAAAISLLERTPRAKKAAPSDRMFDQMLTDYRKALEDGRAALSSTPAADAGWRRVRHKKRGTTYEVLGIAEGQIATPDITLCGNAGRFVTEGVELTVYRAEDGRLYWRFPDEFEDGRFEDLNPEARDER